MTAPSLFVVDTADEPQIAAHLRACDHAFVPPLSERVDIDEYARKIADRARRFEARDENQMVGLVAAYCNDPHRQAAYITSVSVLPGWQGRGIAAHLMRDCIAHVRHLGFARLELEVDAKNTAARTLYEKLGFATSSAKNHSVIMCLPLQEASQ